MSMFGRTKVSVVDPGLRSASSREPRDLTFPVRGLALGRRVLFCILQDLFRLPRKTKWRVYVLCGVKGVYTDAGMVRIYMAWA